MTSAFKARLIPFREREVMKAGNLKVGVTRSGILDLGVHYKVHDIFAFSEDAKKQVLAILLQNGKRRRVIVAPVFCF